MKPVSLEFCGINSFSEPAKIDFTKLTEFGIFGIFGDTGSGKSTILDCIGFALYGNVARPRPSMADLIHYSQDKAYVDFTFEVVYEGRRRTYRVERELRRKNAAQNVKVYERTDEGAYTVLADGVRDANALLARIIGLEQKDFEKCIALPQGEFAQFVRAARGERLKLISRLFDLEAYGERLVKEAGAKRDEAEKCLAVTDAKLERYAGITKESVCAKREETERLAAEETSLSARAAALREEEKALAIRREKRREQETLTAEMSQLSELLPSMKALAGELDRLDKAAAVLRAHEERARSQERERERAVRLAAAEKALRERAEALGASEAWDADRAEAEERALADRIGEAKASEQKRKECAEVRAKLERAQAQLRTEREGTEDFSYDDERRAAEQALAALGSDDFLAFAEKHGKAQLLHAEYAEFVHELQALTAQYPEAAPGTQPLIQKYTALSQGDRTDLATLRARFEARQKEREALHTALVMLEKRKGRRDAALGRIADLSASIRELTARCGELSDDAALPPVSELEEMLAKMRAERQKRIKERERAREAYGAANVAKTSCEEQLRAAKETRAECEARLAAALKEGGFSGADQAKALKEKYGDPERARSRVEEYKERYAFVHSRLRALSAEDLSDATQEKLSGVRSALSECEKGLSTCTRALAVARGELARSEEGLKEKTVLEAERAVQLKNQMLYERLRKLVEGNKFMEFVAEEYLQTVAVNAGRRLLSLTDGRYFLRYEGGFFVGDNFNGGQLRSVSTLSGGETFLVSLSLALALSAEICARSLRPIEFFFLDEGFGTLDERLVDTVMDSLERLKSENFSIGIISHVEELKHRIDRRLIVTKATERHGSQIHME